MSFTKLSKTTDVQYLISFIIQESHTCIH